MVGNCQGGWATMLLAATHPDITGPIVVNVAPLSYWAGRRGRHSMRYAGGLLGGVPPALVASDLGGGRFDGAHLVAHFEAFNPAKTGWTKYDDAWSAIDSDAESFLAFERWWSAFYLMDEAEIRWLVESLFIGNRLGSSCVACFEARPANCARSPRTCRRTRAHCSRARPSASRPAGTVPDRIVSSSGSSASL